MFHFESATYLVGIFATLLMSKFVIESAVPSFLFFLLYLFRSALHLLFFYHSACFYSESIAYCLFATAVFQ